MEMLQERLLYSLIYVVGEGDEPLKTVHYLGELTDELNGDSIEDFVSAGTKTYAYRTRRGKKVVMKVKGITQEDAFCQTYIAIQ